MTVNENAFTSCTPDQTRCRRTHCVPLFLLFILLAVSYANSFKGTWVFDDYLNITENTRLHLESLDWESIKGTFYGARGKINRPLAYLSFGINHYFHGLDEFGYHLVNFIVHCLATVFLYLFIFRTLHLPMLRERYSDRAGSIALLASALWATSPIHVTAVTVIVQRMASMCAMFFIMSMYFYLLGRTTPGLYRKIGWFVLSAVSGAAALATKENAVMLPVALYMLDLLLIQGATKENLKRHLPWLGAIFLFLVVMAFVFTNPLAYLSGTAYENRYFTLRERLLTQPRILVHYLSLMLYPMTDRFALVHEIEISRSLLSPWTTIPAILFWAVWTALGLFLAKRRPLAAFCLLFFVVNHLTESTFIPLELVFEHRNYLPSMTLFLLVAVAVMALLRDFSEKRLIRGLACAIIVVTVAGQGYSVIQYNMLFEHPLFLWYHNAEKAPGMSRVHTNLAQAYIELGLYEEAKKACLASIEANRYQRKDLRYPPLFNLGFCYLQTGEPRKAIEALDRAYAVDPSRWPAALEIARALYYLGEYEDARAVIEEILEAGYDHVRIRSLHCLVLFRLEEYDAAAESARKAVEGGGDPAAYKVLGEVHAMKGEYDEAVAMWETFSEKRPRSLEAQFALLRLGRLRGDDGLMRRAAVRILFLKSEENLSWEDMFDTFTADPDRDNVVFRGDPREMKPLVVKAVNEAVVM